MRKLNLGENKMLDEALQNIWIGTMASQKIEGEDVPNDAERPQDNLNEEERYNLAVSLGVIQG